VEELNSKTVLIVLRVVSRTSESVKEAASSRLLEVEVWATPAIRTVTVTALEGVTAELDGVCDFEGEGEAPNVTLDVLERLIVGELVLDGQEVMVALGDDAMEGVIEGVEPGEGVIVGVRVPDLLFDGVLDLVLVMLGVVDGVLVGVTGGVPDGLAVRVAVAVAVAVALPVAAA